MEGCSEDRISLQEVQATPLHEEEDDANYDSGVALQIPAWDGHPLVSVRLLLLLLNLLLLLLCLLLLLLLLLLCMIG